MHVVKQVVQQSSGSGRNRNPQKSRIRPELSSGAPLQDSGVWRFIKLGAPGSEICEGPVQEARKNEKCMHECMVQAWRTFKYTVPENATVWPFGKYFIYKYNINTIFIKGIFVIYNFHFHFFHYESHFTV